MTMIPSLSSPRTAPRTLPMTTLSVGLAVALAGCSTSPQTQLERVARDWCQTLRASQVIPVYPLTEDLQPGDLFLVESPIPDQKQFYQAKGYLPFENQVGRIHPASYAEFYRAGYGGVSEGTAPRQWQFPDSSNWTNAPLVAFPTYSFSAKSSAGFRAAFPISGVPIGLSMLGNRNAKGSVNISRAHTYGADASSLIRQLDQWRSTNRMFLAGHASSKGHPRFLRLITRVFLAHEMDVALHRSSATSGGGDFGVAKAFDLGNVEGTNAIALYTNSLASLNQLLSGLANSAPGASVRAVTASTRDITLKQAFARPLAIGYLALEFQILPGGDLGPAFSTREMIEGQVGQSIRQEQSQAADIALKVLQGLPVGASTNEWQRFTTKAVEQKVLTASQSIRLLSLAGTDKAQARQQLQGMILDVAQGGTPGNTGRLFELLLALQKP